MGWLLLFFYLWQGSAYESPYGYLRLHDAGSYDASQAYTAGDVVTERGRRYATFKSSKGANPADNSETWMELPSSVLVPNYVIWGPMEVKQRSSEVKLLLAVFQARDSYSCQHTSEVRKMVPPPALGKLLSETPRLEITNQSGSVFTVSGRAGSYGYLCVGQ